MVNATLIITVLLSLCLFIFGLVVFVRNTKDPLNISFFGFALMVSLWLILNYISADPQVSYGLALSSNRLVLIAAGMALVFLLKFVVHLANWSGKIIWWRTIVLANITSWILSLTPLVVQDVKFTDGQVVNIFGPLAAFYFISLFVTFGLIMLVLIWGHYRATSQRRVQLGVIAKSIAIVVPTIMVCNAVFPILGYYGAVSLSPLAITLIVLAMYYAVAVHKLFDLRTFIFRALAYILSTVTLSILYVGPLVYLLDVILGVSVTLEKFVIECIIITLVATNYGRIKKWFDQRTRRIFFRDSYDSAALLGLLNRRLVSTTDLSKLLIDSSELIAGNIKADFCLFLLKDETTGSFRVFDARQRTIVESAGRRIVDMLGKYEDDILIADGLPPEKHKLQEFMSKQDIAVSLRLSTDKNTERNLGYILLGYKKSGNPYNGQDISTMQSIADVLVIAIHNALNYEEIRNFNVTLQKTIEEKTRQLRHTNEKLKSLDEIKDDFISMASHQLRTPLTSVKGYLSMVLDGDAGDLTEMQRKMLDQSFVSSQRMVFLIADLLNVSRLKTGKFIIEPTRVRLQQIVEDEVNQLKETAKSRKLTLKYDKRINLPELLLDETKIRQVIMNFVDNAIYYTPSGGHITVSLHETPASIEMRVEDDGIGIPKHEQPHLFTKFYRAGNARRARPDGTGLGLFMAKKVIVAQGGAVIFSSQEGKGSTFGFIFPKSKILAPAPAKKMPAALAK